MTTTLPGRVAPSRRLRVGGGRRGTIARAANAGIFGRGMPTYVYKFVDTGDTIEIQQSFHDDPLTEAVHPVSGDVLPVKKVYLPVGVTFKGDGFYKTDSRASKAKSKTKSDSTSDSKSDSGGSSSTGDGGSSTASTSGDSGASAGTTSKPAAPSSSSSPSD
jgi:predicted nucleic acid-binding Zn ribbon protein